MHALFWKENLKARYQRCDLGIAVGTALNGCQRKWFRFLLDSGHTRSDTQADVVNTVLRHRAHITTIMYWPTGLSSVSQEPFCTGSQSGDYRNKQLGWINCKSLGDFHLQFEIPFCASLLVSLFLYIRQDGRTCESCVISYMQPAPSLPMSSITRDFIIISVQHRLKVLKRRPHLKSVAIGRNRSIPNMDILATYNHFPLHALCKPWPNNQ